MNDNPQPYINTLNLRFVAEKYEALATEATQKHWSHVRYLTRLLEGEASMRHDKAIARRIQIARFPLIKSLDDFQWTWPAKINRQEVQNLFRLQFLDDNANIIFLGGVGLGKTHLAIALGHLACINGFSVLFSSAIDAVNNLCTAKSSGRLKQELQRYVKPKILILDELGYLPIDKAGADLLFQIISHRYEHGSTIITSNRSFKKWPEIFNNDSTLTSAFLDRLLHHSHTISIHGKSFRMRDIKTEP